MQAQDVTLALPPQKPGQAKSPQSRPHDIVGGLKLKGTIPELPPTHVTIHPVVGAVATQLPFLQVDPGLHVLPAQQIWPTPPQVWHTPFLQMFPPSQTLPLQQVSPTSPQAWQTPFLQVSPEAQQAPLHAGSPFVSQRQVPALLQLVPDEQQTGLVAPQS